MGINMADTAKWDNKSSSMVFDYWNLAGCNITYRNANHPLVKKFFHQMGAEIQVIKHDRILVTGRILMYGGDFNEFLLKHEVDLKANPHALDTVPAENIKSIAIPKAPEKFTPSFDSKKSAAITPEEDLLQDNKESSDEAESWYSYFGRAFSR